MDPCLLSKASIIRAVTVATMVAALATLANAQSTPPCKPLPQDRTITWCYPIDNASFGAEGVIEWGWIKDSLPHRSKEFVDGHRITDPPDIFNRIYGDNFDDQIHTLTIVVTDSLGTFQKSVSYRQSLKLPCSLPTSDRSLNFCIPLKGEVTTSPLRVAGVARSSVGIEWLQVWVDGVKYITEHQAEPVPGNPSQMLINNYVYLPNGNHAVTMIAKQFDGTTIKKTVHVQIVSTP